MDNKEKTVALKIRYADTFFKKLTGLLGTKEFPGYEGLFFPGVRSIHTFFMRYPIDVLFLTPENMVCVAAEAVKPFRVLLGGREASSVIELRTGTIVEKGIKQGDSINLEGKRDV
jgi:uncharacterized protein